MPYPPGHEGYCAGTEYGEDERYAATKKDNGKGKARGGDRKGVSQRGKNSHKGRTEGKVKEAKGEEGKKERDRGKDKDGGKGTTEKKKARPPSEDSGESTDELTRDQHSLCTKKPTSSRKTREARRPATARTQHTGSDTDELALDPADAYEPPTAAMGKMSIQEPPARTGTARFVRGRDEGALRHRRPVD